MRRVVTSAGLSGGALLFLAASAAAQAPGMSLSFDDPPKPKSIAVVFGDWNNDRKLDGAQLSTSEYGADLFIFFGGQDGAKRSSVLVRDFVWHGDGVSGQSAGLKAEPEGRLVVTSQNASMGRDRWSDEMTIGYEKGAFRILRYVRSAHDTLNPDFRQECTLDYVTGKGVLNGERLAVRGGPPLVSDWTMENAPPSLCGVR